MTTFDQDERFDRTSQHEWRQLLASHHGRGNGVRLVPPELAARLALDSRASAVWDALTPAQRKRDFMELAQAKTPPTTARRVDAVMVPLG